MSKIFSLLLVSILICPEIFSQSFSVKGVVMNSSTKETIPICNVYFSGSTIGTMTDADGNFTISNVRPGTYDLIVSHVNYNFKSFPVVIQNKDIDMGNIMLKEKPVETSYAEVKDKADRKWRRQFARFRDYIFGDHYRAREIEIPNSYVAEFREIGGTLVKKSSFALEIKNKYTGYEIYYPIQEFLLGQGTDQFMVGFPRFTLMESDDPGQMETWAFNRRKSYEGSLRHFFKSLLDQSLEENLFDCHLTNDDPQIEEDPSVVRYYKSLKDPDLSGYLEIENTKNERIKKIMIKDFIEVKYLNEANTRGQNQLTYLKANKGFIYVYTNGLLVDPQSVTAIGYLATEGLYEMLPFDYEILDSVKKEP